jgi:hypothetical protein
MKRNNFLIIITIIAAVFFTASCKKDFLDETYTTAELQNFLKQMQEFATGDRNLLPGV